MKVGENEISPVSYAAGFKEAQGIFDSDVTPEGVFEMFNASCKCECFEDYGCEGCHILHLLNYAFNHPEIVKEWACAS